MQNRIVLKNKSNFIVNIYIRTKENTDMIANILKCIYTNLKLFLYRSTKITKENYVIGKFAQGHL